MPISAEAKATAGIWIELHDHSTEPKPNKTSSGPDTTSFIHPEHRVYRRRWFGLVQLMLLNLVVSFDWLSFAPVSNTAAAFYATTPSIINWLSTAFLFAFVVASPFTLYSLHTSGPRSAVRIASVLILLGNWVRYAGTRTRPPSFPITMFGQVLIGLAQPFVLSAPTRFSDLWFTPRGRVSATAAASLANPLGGALAQLIDPFLATSPSQIPRMILYVAIISSVATIPSFLISDKPQIPVSPRPPSTPVPILRQIFLLTGSLTFWLIFLPFSVYVGFFNSLSSLLTQVLTPYGHTETESGIAGTILIIVGLITAAVTSPLIDRYKCYLLLIRVLVPITGVCYLVFIWAPPKSIVASYVICGVLGAASFSLVPVALEWLVEITWPVGPEVSSVICWMGGQALGATFIIVSDALQSDKEGDPPRNMQRALIFEAVIAMAVMPAAIVIGRTNGVIRNKRLENDNRVDGRHTEVEEGTVKSSQNDLQSSLA